jgi:hypothetical protein
MTNNTPIDEYAFWKNLILEMEDKGEKVQVQMFQLMDLAEKKTLDYLLDKFDLEVTDKQKQLKLH